MAEENTVSKSPEKKLLVAVVGKAGHAKRLISCIRKIKGVEIKWVYYPTKCKENGLPMTNRFENVLVCDAVLIASPTFTHVSYLKRLENFKGYILVEKPGVSTQDDISVIENLPNKERLRINYNLRYSEIERILGALVRKRSIGQTIALNVQTSHGLAFSEKYQGSWRADCKCSMGVFELVGVHYINLAITLFGPIEDYDLDWTWNASNKFGIPPDTIWARIKMSDGTRVNLYHSYAGPYFNRMQLICTDGYLEYDGLEYEVHSPRNSLDASGMFTAPPCIGFGELDHAEHWENSLLISMQAFLEDVKSGIRLPSNDLQIALESMKPIFHLRNELEGEKND
jgi:predicted dehydrogenase